MSIFNIDKNSMSLSHDWELFQKFMGNVGAFTYISKEEENISFLERENERYRL